MYEDYDDFYEDYDDFYEDFYPEPYSNYLY